jgi:hypothetical protein
MKLDEQNVVVELTKGAESEDFGKGFGIGVLTTLGCGLVVKLVNRFVIKPIVKKRKEKKEEDFGEMVDRVSKEVKQDNIDDLDD